jgi:hypothetical protein
MMSVKESLGRVEKALEKAVVMAEEERSEVVRGVSTRDSGDFIHLNEENFYSGIIQQQELGFGGSLKIRAVFGRKV